MTVRAGEGTFRGIRTTLNARGRVNKLAPGSGRAQLIGGGINRTMNSPSRTLVNTMTPLSKNG